VCQGNFADATEKSKADKATDAANQHAAVVAEFEQEKMTANEAETA
jgi:hypothetical protein